jgi:hypothetical protein
MNKKNILLYTTIILIITLICTGFLLNKNQNVSNKFFFKSSTSETKFIGTYQSAFINKISATLNIKKVATLQHGILYKLSFKNLQYGKVKESDDMFDVQALMNEMKLGYFYVESNKIYHFYNSDDNSLSKSIKKLNNDVIPEDFILVCSDKGYRDKTPEGKDGTHAYVKANGNKREYHGFDIYNGDGKGYIDLTWEKGRGLIYYRIGFGALRDEVILSKKETDFPQGYKSTDIKSKVNMAPQSAKAKMQSKENQLKWIWCIRPDKYCNMNFIDKDLIAVTENYKKYVIINTSGKKIIPSEYSSVGRFADGFAVVKDNKNTFFINKKGTNIFDIVFEDACSFSCGLAAVEKNGHWGFIDKSGHMVIKNLFDQANNFNEGVAAVEKNNKWGLIDNTGNTVVDFKYDCINDVHEGFAAVEKDGKWGFIDRYGKIIADLQYDKVVNFSEGFAAIMKNKKWGFINKQGVMKISLKYDEVGNFSEGKAAVKLSNYKDGCDEWAYIDSNDNVVIDFFPYDSAGSDSIFCVGEFHEGLAFVSKTLVYIIDAKGNNIFMGDSKFFISSLSYNKKYDAIPAYTYIDDAMKIRKYGLMDLKGNQRLKPVFDYVKGIYGDYVVVENIVDGESKMGLIKIHKNS